VALATFFFKEGCMRKLLFIIGIIMLVGAFGGCAFLLTEKIDFESLPKAIDVSTTNQYFTEAAIKFTGNPDQDFGNSYLFLNKSDGGTWKKVNKVYVAYSRKFLFIGHKNSVDAPDAPDYWLRGAFYIFIDNGITNGNGSKGMKKLENGDSGIAGQFDQFDDARIATVGDRKFSVFIKHYRPYAQAAPTGEDIKIYRMINGVVEKVAMKAGSGTLSWPRYLTNGVTEIQIPWSFIFGDNPEYIPDKIYLEFRIDDAANGDWFKEADFGTNVATTNIISNWLELNIK
jgi:hypothetical protein